MALAHLGEREYESSLAMAVAIASAARRGHSRAAIVTFDSSLVATRRPRGRRSLDLRGFEPVGRSGGVELLDAADAEAASIAAAGAVPVVCVLSAGPRLADDLASICPSSMLIAAAAGADDAYVELLAADMRRTRPPGEPRVLSYGRAAGGAEPDALLADRSAALRFRLGLDPGPVSRANAEVAVAALARA